MQKKALVLAVSALFVVPAALAQKGKPEPDSVIELYGKIYPEVVLVDSKGATSASSATCTICAAAEGENAVIKRTEMQSNNSRFGVRGHEKLGGDLKAIFQLETQFLVDQNDTPFARRDSFIGLDHKRFGTIKLGRMDTPFKEYGDDLSFLGISSGNFMSTSSVYRHVGFGPQQNAARFHERRVNAVQYESPDIGPAEFKIQWSTDEAKTATRDPRVFSVGGQVELGPVTLMAGYEKHWDLFGGSRNARSTQSNFANQGARSEDEAAEIAVKFKAGIHTFELDANKKRYKERGAIAAGRFQSYENNAYMFLMENRWSPQFRTAFHYVKATEGKCSLVNAACNTDGLKGEQISAGFAYHFSRRTYLFFVYTLVKNGYSATFNNTDRHDVNPGEDIQQIALGLHTAF